MLLIEELNKNQHNRGKFDCGLDDVNAFLHKSARKQADQSVNRTWVAVDEGAAAQRPAPVIGYFTLTSCTVAPSDVAGNYPHYPLPALKLAWLGVHRDYQGAHVGQQLLVEAILHAWELYIRTQMGVALVTDPMTQASSAFFRKNGFQDTGRQFQGLNTLYLPISWVRVWVESDLEIDASEVLGTKAQAQAWLDGACPALGGYTPRQMIDVPGGVEMAQQVLYQK